MEFSSMIDFLELAVKPAVDDFDSLHEDYREKVYRVILRMVRNPMDAEDLTQETFLKAARNLPEIKHPEKTGSWLYRIATNAALDYLRRRARRSEENTIQVGLEDRETIPIDAPAPASFLDSIESANCFHLYADRLPEQYHVVLVLHYLEGLPLAQVAEVMGSTVGATKVRLHRARKRYAEMCVEECEQFFNEEGVFLCQPKSKIPEDFKEDSPCDSEPSDCSCA
jgi:RNA polymerase sigma-70 factor (ECF subfamily)